MKVHLAHAQGWEYILQVKWHQIFFHIEPLSWIWQYTSQWSFNPQDSLHITLWQVQVLECPSGLAQAPAYFQELINKILKDLSFTIAHLDDIIMYSETAEDHLDYLKQVL